MTDENQRQINEVWALFRETSTQIAELGKRIDSTNTELGKRVDTVNASVGALTGKWGKFVENFLVPGVPELFQARGIPVHRISQRVKSSINGEHMEIDILVVNKGHVIPIEVKSTLGVDDVRDFLKTLNNFKRFFDEYKDRKVLGAVAGIVMEKSVSDFAYRQGLFVLGQKGANAVILNDTKFKPKEW